MTRVEIREARKKQFRKAFSLMLGCCFISFLCGFSAHRGICKSTHDIGTKVDIFNS